jgi:hypothetical protein
MEPWEATDDQIHAEAERLRPELEAADQEAATLLCSELAAEDEDCHEKSRRGQER